MELRITNDAASFVGLDRTLPDSSPSEVGFLDVWGVHVFEHRRRMYFLLTEGVSFFSIVTLADKIRSRSSFERTFRSSLISLFAGLFEGEVPSYLLPDDIGYSKTRNDGLRRAQSDQIWRAKAFLDEGTDTFMINRIPYKSLGFEFPVDQFVKGVSARMKENGDHRTFVPDDLTRN